MSTENHKNVAKQCKVTGRRRRVSPCRSAYFASPWWLLTLDLWRHSREAALLFPESWWHPTMRDSRPSLFMIIPNTKGHPNTTKTDQFPISEVITGLPRPCHKTSTPSVEGKRLPRWTLGAPNALEEGVALPLFPVEGLETWTDWRDPPPFEALVCIMRWAKDNKAFYILRAGSSLSPPIASATNAACMYYLLECQIFSTILTAMNSRRGWHSQFFCSGPRRTGALFL